MTVSPICPPLAAALAEREYTDLTPVQTAVLALEAQGRDLLVSAQTGSGKTVAFGLGIADTLLDGAETLPPAGQPMALIIAPTRELALQVQRELVWLYARTGARVVSCVGGMDPRQERRALGGGAHIVVGTPGRLRDHLERNALDLTALKAVVLDEADEMLDMGFREDLEIILNAAPEERRTLLFSATLPKDIVTLATRYQRNAFRIAAAGGERGHADIEYRAIRVIGNEIEHAVVNLLRFVDSQSAIVFCNTRNAVRHLQATLVERGFSAVYLSGELSQNERNQALQALRDGRSRICVATDVAARGIDLPNLGLVIHAELPNDAETLQHRSGRTGRAGKKGISALIVPMSRKRKAERLIQDVGVRAVWAGAPTADDIRKLDRQRLLTDPLLTEEPTEEDRAMAAELMAGRSADDIAAALARLYRSRLPEPEEITELAPDRDQRPAKGRDRDAPRDNARDGGRERGAERGGYDPVARDRRNLPEHATGPSANGFWFRINVGRRHRADPKWLLPMLCRRGNISRNEIGTINIFDRVTEVEILKEAAEHFANHSQFPLDPEDTIRFEPIWGKADGGDAGAPPPRPPRPDKPRADRPHGDKPRGPKPERRDGKPPFAGKGKVKPDKRDRG